jgi:LPXTG-site transpeptidase (sortase) family protein
MSLGRIAVAGLGVALAALGSAVALQDFSQDRSPTPVVSGQESGAVPFNKPTAVVGTTFHRHGRPAWKPGTPRRVVIQRLRMDAPVVPISTIGNALTPPSDPQLLGWWAAGARPGARTGSALVTGHTVHTGGGAMDNLERMRPGDRVTVYTGRGIIPYDVRSVEIFNKGSVAQHAQRLFSQEVSGRLVLVTCEDWDGTRYLSNVVVVARPVRA